MSEDFTIQGGLYPAENSSGKMTQGLGHPLRDVATSGSIYGWADNIQFFSSAKGNGATTPTWADMGNGIFAYRFSVNDELYIAFHVQHDYKRGTTAYPHVHFVVDQTMTAGQEISWRFAYTIAKGHQQGESLTGATTAIDMTYTATGNEVAGEHIILECSDEQSFSLIEPDVLIMAAVTLTAENVAGNIFGLMADLHYQTDRIGTENKAPNFYG